MPSRTVVVLDAIKHAILTGELQPGQGLVETDLAGVLGVSKTPVREALKTLAGAGLVTMSPYKGAAVRAVDDDLVRSVYDLRLLLEPRPSAAPWPTAVRAARPGMRCSGRTRPLTGLNAAWPTVTSTAPSTSAAATPCSSACWMTCVIRPPWCPRRPGSARRPGEPKPPSTRRFSARPPPATRMTAARLLTSHIESFLARNYPSLAETESLTETGDTDAP